MAGIIQRSLSGGEINEELYGRADTAKYNTAVKRAENFFIRKNGTMTNRAGTEYVTEVKTSSLATYLGEFIFSDDQTYIIEIGNLYLRIINDGVQLSVSPSAYAGGTTYAAGDTVSYSGTNYWSRVDGNVGNQPDVSAAQWYAMPGSVLEILTPYATADIADLQLAQSNDVITFTAAGHPVYELTRLGATEWSFLTKAFSPSIAAPTGLSVTSSGGGGDKYVVTSIADESAEESLASSEVQSTATATSGAPLTVSWSAVSGAVEYNVYKHVNGVFGYIGTAAGASPSFEDNDIVPDFAFTPPVSRTPFAATDDYPYTSAYYQQRQVFGGTNNNPDKIWTSRSSLFSNYSISYPLQADDSVTFSVVGKQFNGIRHIVDLNTLVVLTASGEYRIEGNADGILLANENPNPRRIGYNGASKVTPVVMDTNLVFLGKDNKTVRDLRANKQTTYLGTFVGNDLTLYAGHLFRNKTITRMAFAQNPDSLIYFVRSDGTLLVLTYLPDQEIWGWTRQVTDGWFEDVKVVPEGNVDVAYVVVRRIIDGATKRYIERIVPRDYTDVTIDARFMDSFLSYDGRNTGATTLTLSTGAGWTVNDDITITASASEFVAGDVGNSYTLKIIDSDEESATYGETTESVKLDISAYTSPTVVTATPRKDVPASLQSTALDTWAKSVDQLSGLDHLEGKSIAAIGDGNVIATPLNSDYSAITVTSGSVTLDDTYEVIHVGLGYKSDIVTLDIDMAQSQDLRSRRKLVTHIDMLVAFTRGVFAGPDADNLNEFTPESRDDYTSPVDETTGLIEIPINNTWNSGGSFMIRQKDPLPATILALIPQLSIGG